jgi:dinuclear metal center YbgI/SA1388 family protein
LGFDKIGLQVGSLDAEVGRAVVSLDRSLGATEFAGQIGAQLLLSHHPLIFSPISSVDTRSHEGRTIMKLIQQGTSFVAAHTNWDAAMGGINDTLASMFGLADVKPFGTASEVKNLKLVFFCPADAVERVIDSVSAEGAGVIGAYRRCAFLSEGKGTYVPQPDADPAIGEPCEKESVDEVRVEMVLPEDRGPAVGRALRKAHPYEEPSFNYLLMTGVHEQPLGRVGMLPAPMLLSQFVEVADRVLDTRSLAWGDPGKRIRKVAVVGGAADGDWMAAQRADADVMVTGEVKQHVALEASESGMCLLSSGHYATEHPGCGALRDRMSRELPEIEWTLFTPEPGRSGRPF